MCLDPAHLRREYGWAQQFKASSSISRETIINNSNKNKAKQNKPTVRKKKNTDLSHKLFQRKPKLVLECDA